MKSKIEKHLKKDSEKSATSLIMKIAKKLEISLIS